MAPLNQKPVVRYEGKFLRFLDRGSWEYVERVNCTGIVLIFPLTDEGNVIFVDQLRVAVAKRVIEFPAGLVSDKEAHDGESLEDAALRELEEETGYHAAKLEPIMEGPVNPAISANQVVLFRAHGLKKVSEGGGDHTENIVVHEVPLKEVGPWLEQKRREGLLIDPKVYMGLYFLKP